MGQECGRLPTANRKSNYGQLITTAQRLQRPDNREGRILAKQNSSTHNISKQNEAESVSVESQIKKNKSETELTASVLKKKKRIQEI